VKWANLEAAEFYERTLEAADGVPDLSPVKVAEVWELLGDCRQLSGKLDEAAEAYEAAHGLRPSDSPEAIELLYKQGGLRREMGLYDESVDWFERGLGAIEHLAAGPAHDKLELELELGIAGVRFRQGDFADCISRAMDVVEKALATDEQLQLGNAYSLLHLAHTQQGSPERAAFRALALPIFEELGDLERQATVLNNVGIEAYYDGEWANALEVYERSRVLFERIGDVASVAMATNNIGEILSDQGRLEEAEELFRTVQETTDPIGHRGLSLMSRFNLGRAAARGGRFSEADELLREAVDGFREIHAASFERESHARIAEAAALAGDAERALREAAITEGCSDEEPPPGLRALLHRVRAYAYLQLERPEEAARELELSIEAARSGAALYELALSLRAAETLRGDVAEDGAAQQLFDRLGVESVPGVPG
jgi:tetratricopeptide (TPR) repeat protein